MQKINQNKPEDTQFLQYCNVFIIFWIWPIRVQDQKPIPLQKEKY